MASLKSWVAKLEDAAEADRARYKELAGGGGFILDIENVEGSGYRYEDVLELKKGLVGARSKISSMQKELMAFEGFKPDEVLTLREELEQLRIAGDGKGKEALERLKKELGEKHQRELDKAAQDIKARDRQLAELDGLLDTEAVDAAAGTALTKHRGDDILLPHVKAMLRSVKGPDGKKRQVRVIDPATGNEVMSSRSGSMDPMTPDELVESMKTKYPKNFSVEVASGSGANGGAPQPGSNGALRLTRDQMRDPNVYEAAKKRADAAGVKVEIV
jgi:hypothetical protein